MRRRLLSPIMAFIVPFLFASVLLAQTDIELHRECAYCGMDRKAYGYSRMLVHYADGTEAGVCSLHCAVIEVNSHQDRTIRAILVADRESRMLVNAEQAVWVMGGGKRGVMTQQPAWAFATRSGADAFIARSGGKIVTWPEVLAAAKKEVEAERR